MPVSTSIHLSYCAALVMQANPASVLDVGCGFGMWGFLCRTYLDVFNGRVWPHEWAVRIDAIEYFEPYIQAHQRHLYNTIHIGDACDCLESLDEYDLIIAGDVIEHLEKDRALALLARLHAQATKLLIVNIPLGTGWDHPAAYGNPAELHRSQWDPRDFLPYASACQKFQLPCGEYGVFACWKDPQTRAEILCNCAQELLQQGHGDEAIARLREASELDGDSPEVAAGLADALLKLARFAEARDVLSRAVDRNPAFHRGYLFLADLHAAMGRPQEGVPWIRRLLARIDLPPEIRAAAHDKLRALRGAHLPPP